MPAPSTPGRRFRLARERLGLTQIRAAEAIGIGQSQISDFERGHERPSLDKLHSWCISCGIDPHEVDQRLASVSVG